MGGVYPGAGGVACDPTTPLSQVAGGIASRVLARPPSRCGADCLSAGVAYCLLLVCWGLYGPWVGLDIASDEEPGAVERSPYSGQE